MWADQINQLAKGADALIQGETGDFAKVITSTLHGVVPSALDAIAMAIPGVGKVRDTIENLQDNIRTRVQDAIGNLFDSVLNGVKGLFGTSGPGAGQMLVPPVTGKGKNTAQLSVFADGSMASIRIRRGNTWEAVRDTGTAAYRRAMEIARDLLTAKANVVRLTPPLPPSGTANMPRGRQRVSPELRTAIREVMTLNQREKTQLETLCGELGCFAGGTMLMSPTGPKAIEEFAENDPITSRNEFEPGGELEVKLVEKVFRRSAHILHLHVGGQVIRTTGEHPFFAYNKGWVKAVALVAGDRLLCADGQWVAVEDMLDTGEWEVVFNLRIADYHTYFVTDWDWGFSVWSHNTCDSIALGFFSHLVAFRNAVCPTALIQPEWNPQQFTTATNDFDTQFQ